MSMTKS